VCVLEKSQEKNLELSQWREFKKSRGSGGGMEVGSSRGKKTLQWRWKEKRRSSMIVAASWMFGNLGANNSARKSRSLALSRPNLLQAKNRACFVKCEQILIFAPKLLSITGRRKCSHLVVAVHTVAMWA
jgi:hypothetical protein